MQRASHALLPGSAHRERARTRLLSRAPAGIRYKNHLLCRFPLPLLAPLGCAAVAKRADRSDPTHRLLQVGRAISKPGLIAPNRLPARRSHASVARRSGSWHEIPIWLTGGIRHPYLYMTGTDYEHTEERDDNTFKDLYHYTDISQREIDSGRPCGDLSTLVQAKEDYAPCYGGGTEHLDTYLYISLYGHFNVGEASSSGFYTMSWRATR